MMEKSSPKSSGEKSDGIEMNKNETEEGEKVIAIEKANDSAIPSSGDTKDTKTGKKKGITGFAAYRVRPITHVGC